MPTTATRRLPAALGTALAAGVLLMAAAHSSRAAAPAPAPARVQAQAFAPTLPGARTVVCKLGRALLEERDAQINLRTETYRDEIEMASAHANAPTPAGPVRG